MDCRGNLELVWKKKRSWLPRFVPKYPRQRLRPCTHSCVFVVIENRFTSTLQFWRVYDCPHVGTQAEPCEHGKNIRACHIAVLMRFRPFTLIRFVLNRFQERFQIGPFSNKNALVWSGPQSLSFLSSANSGTHENWKPPIVRRDLSFARKLHKSTQAQILQENSLIFVWNYQAFPASSWLGV